MRTVNHVHLLGLLGNDPKIYAMANGTLVSRFSLATENIYKVKVTNIIKKNTEWHAVVVFGKLAEIAERFLQKGTQVYLEGSLKTREYEDDEKTPKRVTEIIVNDLVILNNPKDQPIVTHFNFPTQSPHEAAEVKDEA